MRFIILFKVVKTYYAILYIVGYVKWEVLQVVLEG